MRILHIASFVGNLGDIVNHEGFYKKFSETVESHIEIEQVEIRLFYNNCRERKFDSNFLQYVNTFDLLILGGGGLFTVEWDYSDTATTINMSKDFINGIKIPVIVNAMGYHENANDSKLFQKFENFISYISDKKNWLITFRNDGSIERLQKRFGCDYGIMKVPDNGFIVPMGMCESQKDTNPTVGFLITNDLFDMQYNILGVEEINKKIISLVCKVLKDGYNVVFLNHTPKDVQFLEKILKEIPEVDLRSKVVISPYSTRGKQCIYDMERYYKMCNCIVSMRFHGNILGMKYRVPMIGLAGHQQIEDLFKEMNLEEQLVVINNPEFDTELLEKIIYAIENEHKIIKKQETVIQEIELQSHKYFDVIKKFLK